MPIINGALVTRANYLRAAFDDLDKLARTARELLPDHVDTLVGQGLSGALVVPALARELGLYWMLVRKPGDGTHSSYSCEGSLGASWVFVDDLIETGATRKRVRHYIDLHAGSFGWSTTYVGDFLYYSGGQYTIEGEIA